MALAVRYPPGAVPAGSSLRHPPRTQVWSGITADYYLGRYQLFADAMAAAIAAGRAVDVAAYVDALTALGTNFTRGTKVYPAAAVGDAVAISQRLFDKYARAFRA